MDNRDKLQITNVFRQMEWRKDSSKNKMFKVDLFNDYGVHFKLHSTENGSMKFKKKADVTVPVRFDELIQVEAMIREVAGSVILNKDTPDYRVSASQVFTKGEKKIEVLGGTFPLGNEGKLRMGVAIELTVDGQTSKILFPSAELFKLNSENFGCVGTKRMLEMSDVLKAIMVHSSTRLDNHFKKFFEQAGTVNEATRRADNSGSEGSFDDSDEMPF